MVRLKNLLFVLLSTIVFLPVSFAKEMFEAVSKNKPKQDMSNILNNYSKIYKNAGSSVTVLIGDDERKVTEFDQKRKDVF